jgi:hypothetical protein
LILGGKGGKKIAGSMSYVAVGIGSPVLGRGGQHSGISAALRAGKLDILAILLWLLWLRYIRNRGERMRISLLGIREGVVAGRDAGVVESLRAEG